jgi:hypothetical protein
MKKVIEQMEGDTTYDIHANYKENDIFNIKKLSRTE